MNIIKRYLNCFEPDELLKNVSEISYSVNIVRSAMQVLFGYRAQEEHYMPSDIYVHAKIKFNIAYNSYLKVMGIRKMLIKEDMLDFIIDNTHLRIEKPSLLSECSYGNILEYEIKAKQIYSLPIDEEGADEDLISKIKTASSEEVTTFRARPACMVLK